jgi:hypothetical protein
MKNEIFFLLEGGGVIVEMNMEMMGKRGVLKAQRAGH